MLTPACVDINTHFYPIGNTPAHSLVQFMPPGKATDVLLLGCGDLRNVLFTIHVDGRKLDVTCCDNQKGIIARNILLLSLVIDDDGNRNSEYLWEIYYHLSIGREAFDLLRSQAKKLFDASATMNDWQKSKYGSRLIFCDSATLLDARAMWSFYCANQKESDFKRNLESAVTKARCERGGVGCVFDASRSAIPAHYHSVKDLIELERHYWKYRSYDLTASTTTTKHPNPTCLAEDSDGAASLHYGTNPLLGFHLMTSYAPVCQGSSGSGNTENLGQRGKVVANARKEFHDWITSYRKAFSEIKVRFFIGDAVPFAHTLQHKRLTKDDTANLYRKQYSLQRLVLNGPDYKSGVAPLSFDVIDTSNLCDHLGPLTLLTAASPLLRNHTSSVLFTETKLSKNEKPEDTMARMLCGDIPSVSTLLGLFPVEYWTNTSPISIGDERALAEDVGKDCGIKSTGFIDAPTYFRASWKRPLCMISLNGKSASAPGIRFDAKELARVLYTVHLQMFIFETYTQTRDINIYFGYTSEWYHRASFASFLRLVQTRVTCDWNATMHTLMDLIIARPNALIAMGYIEELYLYLYMLGIFSADFLEDWDSRVWLDFEWAANLASPFFHTPSPGKQWGDLRDWEVIPPVVCLTLKIPRKKLGVFTKMDHKHLGTPFLHCRLEGVPSPSEPSPWQHIFLACQLTFGEVFTDGEKWDQSFRVSVVEDEAGWNGSSPLVATFYVPGYWLLKDLREGKASLGICPSPITIPKFVPKLDEIMTVYETTLGNSDAVYITRYAPNQTGFPVAPGFAQSIRGSSVNVGADISLAANVDEKTGVITTYTGRIDVTSEDYKQALENGGQVTKSNATPSETTIQIGQTSPLTLSFPTFMAKAGQKLRIARKSGYIEVIAPVGNSSTWMEYPESMYPVYLQDGSPVNWNMPYLQLSKCPIIETTKEEKPDWMAPHLALSMSKHEVELFQKPELPRSPGEEVRLNFKSVTATLFGYSIGLEGNIGRAFILQDSARIPQIVVMVSSLRVDLANRAPVLDCAVALFGTGIPMNALHRISQSIKSLGVSTINIGAAELHLWRQALAAYVERCRTWSHRADCDYVRSGSIPLNKSPQQFLCACGKGKFTRDFETNGFSDWEVIKRYAVRAAISPAFWAPFMDRALPFIWWRPETDMHIRRCASCGKAEKDGSELLKCARCKRVSYCSKDCQRSDWKTHKMVCKP